MILGVLCVTAAFQLSAYALVSRYRFGTRIVLGILVASNLFLFPSFFMPEYEPGEPHCGLPDMAIRLGFWIIGNAAVLGIHLGHRLYAKWSRK